MVAANHDGQHGNSEATIAVIGAGFSGAATVYHLAKQARRRTRVHLIDPAQRVGRGLAYGCSHEHLLLNVPAGRLSVDPAKPGDFHEWCLSTGLPSNPGAFHPRAWFGEYVESRMSDALEAASGTVTLDRVRDQAISLKADAEAVTITTRHGTCVRADHAVLALGHGPTKIPAPIRPWAEDDRVVRSSFDPGIMKRVAQSGRRILLIGSGLTMFDAALTLAREGFSGQMTAISRRGRQPMSHGPKDESAHADWASQLRGTEGILPIMRAVRERCGAGDVRGAIDSIRPHTQRLWSELSWRDRERFLTHAAVHWDSARHRCAPEIAASISVLIARGSLTVSKARLQKIDERRGVMRAHLSLPTDLRERSLNVDAIVLCSGPDLDPRRWRSPLVDTLLRDGLVSVDPLGLGLSTDSVGRILPRDVPAEGLLSTLGPLRKGQLWESTAVPEISVQAAGLAHAILDQLASRFVRPRASIKEIAS